MLFGQKNHAHAVLARRWQLDAYAAISVHTIFGHIFTVKIVRQLDQNACTVATQLVRTHGTPVVQVLQDLQTVLDDRMRFSAFDMRHKAHATSVFLTARLVQATRCCGCNLNI